MSLRQQICELADDGRSTGMQTKEQTRLDDARSGKASWRKWGPYLSERQWGTVREDYSDSGDAWNFFLTTTHAPALTAGVRMALPASPMTNSGFVLRSHCGMGRTRSSRNGCLG